MSITVMLLHWSNITLQHILYHIDEFATSWHIPQYWTGCSWMAVNARVRLNVIIFCQYWTSASMYRGVVVKIGHLVDWVEQHLIFWLLIWCVWHSGPCLFNIFLGQSKQKSGTAIQKWRRVCSVLYRPSQAKILTGDADLRLTQVGVPLSVSHFCVWPHRWAL